MFGLTVDRFFLDTEGIKGGEAVLLFHSFENGLEVGSLLWIGKLAIRQDVEGVPEEIGSCVVIQICLERILAAHGATVFRHAG